MGTFRISEFKLDLEREGGAERVKKEREEASFALNDIKCLENFQRIGEILGGVRERGG